MAIILNYSVSASTIVKIGLRAFVLSISKVKVASMLMHKQQGRTTYDPTKKQLPYIVDIVV